MNHMKTNLNYNPDVLDALANLSNDEVFTPPKLVNEVLDMLPSELWNDKNATFLDPATKSGVFLREIAKRLIEGLEKEIPDLQERLNHIYTKQLFGIGITELTSLLARRSLYCSKIANHEKYSVCTEFENPDGNIRFERIEHAWKNGKCEDCGASEGEYDRHESLETHAYEFIHKKPEEIISLFNKKDMKFDVIIGNPPYQMGTGGPSAQATPLYDKFVQQAKKLNPRFLSMIIPARWYSGGMGLNDFRSDMLNDQRLRKLVDYTDSSECFPGVSIKGGICYFLWNRDDRGLCNVLSITNGQKKESDRFLVEEGSDIFIRFNEAISILRKVKDKKEKLFYEFVSSQKPFGFPTNFRGKSKPFKDSIKIYVTKGINYIDRNLVEKNIDLIDSYKILNTKGYGAGESFPHQILNKPILAEPGTCCSETYIVLGIYKNREEAENAISYIKTKFFRFLVMLQKNTQDSLKRVYKFVPIQDFSEEWTDEKLYKKYKLTKEEIDFIESMIRPME